MAYNFGPLGAIAAEIKKLLILGLPASFIRRGQLGLARLPSGAQGSILVGQGSNSPPAYSGGSPLAGQLLAWNGSAWVPTAFDGDAYLNYDSSGYDKITVQGLQGQFVAATLPSSGSLLGYAFGSWLPVAVSGDASCAGAGVFTVTGLQGNAVSSSAPATGQALQYTGSAWTPGNPAAVDRFTINGGFDFFQAQGPSSASYTFAGPNAGDKYVADQFLANNQSGLSGWAVSRVAGGPNSTNYIKFLQSARADKLIVYQPIEAAVSQALSNGTVQVTFQVQVKMPAGAAKVNIGILEWSGTADTMALTTTGVLNAWSSTSASDPTWTTNFSLVGKASLTASSSWQLLSTTVTLDASKNNILPVLWLDAQSTSSGELDLAEWQLTPAPCAVPWVPEDPAVALARCQRFFEKSWDADTKPGTSWTIGSDHVLISGAVAPFMTGDFTFQVSKRTVPTLTAYDSTGASGVISTHISGGAWGNGSAVSIVATRRANYSLGANNVTNCNSINFAFTADARLG